MPETTDTYEILRSIRTVVRRISEHSRWLSQDAGLTVPQLLVLKAVGDSEGPATVVGVANAVQMAPSTVSGVLDRLERQGLVRRERGTEDRRKVFVLPTEAGRERLAHLPAPMQEVFVDRLEQLPAAQRRRIREVLDQVVDMMDAEGGDAAPVLDGKPLTV